MYCKPLYQYVKEKPKSKSTVLLDGELSVTALPVKVVLPSSKYYCQEVYGKG